MAGVELEFDSATTRRNPPPESPVSPGPTSLIMDTEERSEVNNFEHDDADQSDDDHNRYSPQPSWSSKKLQSIAEHFTLRRPTLPKSDMEEEEDLDDESEGGQRSFSQQHPEFLNSRVSKFQLPVNGHTSYQQQKSASFNNPAVPPYHYSKQHGGNGRRLKSFLEHQFNFPAFPPHDVIHHNNNNYKEGTVKDLLNYLPGQRSSERERSGTNHGQFLIPPLPTGHDLPAYHFHPPSRDGAGATFTSNFPQPPHLAPLGKETPDLKPDLNSSGGLNLLSRSLGTALLNLASLAPGGTGGSLPLNLSNGIGPTGSTSRTTPSPPFATTNFPQLILASGQIVQGIQGAQVLIPSPQGLLTQTVLTIPITQPLSPLDPTTPTIPKKTRPTTPHSLPTEPKESTNQKQHIPLISQKMAGLDRNLNIRSSLVNRRRRRSHSLSNGTQPIRGENSNSPLISATLGNHPEEPASSHHGYHINEGYHGHDGPLPQRTSPMSSPLSHDVEEKDDESDFLDRCSDNDEDTMMDGINLDEIKEFAKAFKLRRLSLGLTQTQVGQALSVTEGPAYSQSAICSALTWQLTQAQSQTNRALPNHHQHSVFEKLDITPKSAQKIKPVLEKWMKEAEDRYRSGNQNLNEFVGMEPSKKRKRRTSFTPQALEILNTHFERNTHPSGAEITTVAHQLGYEREVIRIWFCNKRQALKNTVRMMSKSGSPS